MNRKLKACIWTAGTAIGLGLFSIHSWSRANEHRAALEPESQRPITVIGVPVDRAGVSDWIYGAGVARAVRRVSLAFEVEERVAELGRAPDGREVCEGMRVVGPVGDEKGQLIARLDDEDFAEELSIARAAHARADREVAVAQARLVRAEAQADLARTRFTRIRDAHASSAATMQELSYARAELRVAEASVATALAQVGVAEAALKSSGKSVAQASRNYDRTRLYAPWTGTIGRLNVRVGDYATSSSLDVTSDDAMAATFPVTLVDTSSFEVSVEVPMYRIDGLKPGNPAFIQRQNAAVETPGDRDGTWYPAEVVAVAPILSPKTRSVRVRLRALGTSLPLIDGEFVRTKVLQRQETTLVVPVTAVISRDNAAHVFVVDPASGVVESRVVQVGVREDDRVAVRDGLREGEVVVTEGRQRLVAGDTVALLEGESTNRGSPDA